MYFLNTKINGSQNYFYLRIFDTNPRAFYKLLNKALVENEEFIGEMISGCYQIIDQVMYFKNSAIKMNLCTSGKINLHYI